MDTQERERLVRKPKSEETVLDLVQTNPGICTRDIASHVGISRITVWQILHTNEMRPYHIQRVQLLDEGDFAPRLAFSRWYLQIRARDPVSQTPFCSIFVLVTFTRKGMFNSHNTHQWSEKNPYATRTRASQERFSANVGFSIVGDHLVGPYLLKQRLTDANYLLFLQQVLPQPLDDKHVSTVIRSSVWFQHDGPSTHYSTDVRLHLNATYR